MPSGADLFVVCKQCGSEVSPYITECPYCGHRLRRRAPKLPRAHGPERTQRGRSRLGAVLARRGRRAGASSSGVAPSYGSGRWEGSRPYVTIALVAAGCGLWVATRAHPPLYSELVLHAELAVRSQPAGLQLVSVGPLHGHWWRLLSTQLAYANGVYAFATMLAVAIFGWLLERRHGPAVVLALFLGAGVAGGLVATAVYTFPVAGGGNAGALALIGAWVAPDLRAARARGYYEGDLLGAAAFAALLVAIPFATPEASWLAGVSGGLIGLLLGYGLSGMRMAER
jgi:membrane associated rhomboid family serine protease